MRNRLAAGCVRGSDLDQFKRGSDSRIAQKRIDRRSIGDSSVATSFGFQVLVPDFICIRYSADEVGKRKDFICRKKCTVWPRLLDDPIAALDFAAVDDRSLDSTVQVGVGWSCVQIDQQIIVQVGFRCVRSRQSIKRTVVVQIDDRILRQKMPQGSDVLLHKGLLVDRGVRDVVRCGIWIRAFDSIGIIGGVLQPIIRVINQSRRATSCRRARPII